MESTPSILGQFGFGWLRDLPDPRDRAYGLSLHLAEATISLPARVDLRLSASAPIFDQGYLSSCTANAIATALQFARIREGLPPFNPSRLFIYYNERKMEGRPITDTGAYIRDGIKSVANDGFAHEAVWPYVEDQVNSEPPPPVYLDAQPYQAVEYYRLDNSKIAELKSCLAAGFPFVFGFVVYDNFSISLNNGGFVPMPDFVGIPNGHAVVAVGFDDSNRCFIIQNSWGNRGDSGYFYFPYDLVADPQLSSDFWTIRTVTFAQSVNGRVQISKRIRNTTNKTGTEMNMGEIDNEMQSEGIDQASLVTLAESLHDAQFATERRSASCSVGKEIRIASAQGADSPMIAEILRSGNAGLLSYAAKVNSLSRHLQPRKPVTNLVGGGGGTGAIGPIQSGSVVFSDGMPVGGSSELWLFPNGDCIFRGGFHDSGFPSYNVVFSWTIKTASGVVFLFEANGHMAGTIEAGSRDYNWEIRTNNSEIAAHWGELRQYYERTWYAHVEWDVAAAIDAIIKAIGIVTKIIKVIGG